MCAVVQWLRERLAALIARGERGAAAVEYGLLVALIAVAIIGAVILFGGKLNSTFSCVATSMPSGTSPAATAGC